VALTSQLQVIQYIKHYTKQLGVADHKMCKIKKFSVSPQYITDILQHVLNTEARLVTSTQKYDHGLSQLLHDELHWLDVPGRVQYKLAVTMLQCLQNRAPKYLFDCCVPVSDITTPLVNIYNII